MSKLIVYIRDVLDDVSGGEDQCIDRLIGSIEKRDGVNKITLKQNEESTLQLNINFNEKVISEDQIKHIAVETGKKLEDTFGHLWIKIQEVSENNHPRLVTALLKNFKGVMAVSVVSTGWILLEFNRYMTQESLLRELIGKLELVIN